MWTLPVAVLLAAAGLAAQESNDGVRSIREGVFSEKQVRRGRRIYEERCQSCHLIEQFTASTFLKSWQGQPVHALFSLVRKTMPEDNPGNLKRREYAEVLAFIFNLNKIPAGETDMKKDDATLKQILIESPATEGGGNTEID